MRKIIVLTGLLLASPALAQQQPDPAFMQKALMAIQQQRNAAMDGQAQFQAQAAMQAEEIAKLKARIAELEKATPPPPKPSE